jgi:hypothetical protein
MNTSYDTIYVTFLNNCKVSDIDLPQFPEQQFELIKNAVMHFNNKFRTRLFCDDILEELSEELDEDSLLILAHYIRLIFLINQKTYYETLWQPFQKDLGLKNFSTQLRSLESSVKEQERFIDNLIANTEEDFL